MRTVQKPGLLFKSNYDFNDGTTQGSTANPGAIKNIANRLYVYATSAGTSPGMRRNFTGLTAGTTYTVSVTIDDSIGTNTYSIYVTNQYGATIVTDFVNRGTYSYSFSLASGGAMTASFFIGSNNTTTFPLAAHDFYVDDIQLTYTGMTTVQEAVDGVSLWL